MKQNFIIIRTTFKGFDDNQIMLQGFWTFECLLPATMYCRIALILKCGRIPGFVSRKINNVAGLAQSELENVTIGIAIN